MPWGTTEGGDPQPYRISVESAHWEKARNRDGELVTNRNGENMMNLVLEGDAYRLVEDGDGFSVGDAIEPLDGKHNKRSFNIGWTDRWVDPREDGKKIESVRGPDEMPWARSELGRLAKSLVELVGADALDEWGPWEKADTWAGHTFDLAPTHDVNDEGEPVTYKTRSGDKRVDWYFVAVAVDEAGGGKKSGGRRKRNTDNGDLPKQLKKAFKAFEGTEDEFVAWVQSEEFEGAEELAKVDDDTFDTLIETAVG